MGGKLLNKRREGYRGWMLENLSVEQVIRVHPSTWTAAKLIEFPQDFIWPRFNDFAGARVLIDAVMNRDAASIQKCISLFPEFDLGLEPWWTTLKAEFLADQMVHRTVLRQRSLDGLRSLRLELETHRETGCRSLVAGIYRGAKRISHKTILQESP